jgi:Cu2+-exporting ATPase
MTEPCFHCGAALTPNFRHAVQFGGQRRPVCCGGCEAAANLILSQGLERYYEFRTPAPLPPGFVLQVREWQAFDREAALRRYTHLRADGSREVSLRIGGLHCAACGWLIESSVGRAAGVHEIHLEPASARAELRYDPRQISLSELLSRIHTLGYDPEPLSFTGAAPDWSAQRRDMLRRLGVAAFGMMAVMTYATSLYAGAMEGMTPDLEQLLRLVSLVVSTPVVLYAAQPFFAGAWRGLRARILGMDLPVALSIGLAYTWSAIATLRGTGIVYFDSAVMFTFFLLLGRFIELTLRARAGVENDAFARLLPDAAVRVREAGTERVLPEELCVGDRVRVFAGERIPADGEIVNGQSELDESLLTGEAAPRSRGKGDAVIAGTLNLSSVLELQVTRVGQDSTLAAMRRLLGQARAARPRLASSADRVAAWFVAAVLVLSIAAGAWWWHADPARAFPIALAVLVVTCPCALSLATPAALAAASARLARGGILVARGRALENLVRADYVVFDKTGTLTVGEPRIARVQPLSGRADEAGCLEIAAALERHSGHPIARAFANLSSPIALTDVTVAPSRGLEGHLGACCYRIGREEYVRAGCKSMETPQCASLAGSAVVLGDRQGLLAAFTLTDPLKSDAHGTIAQLRALGLRPVIASGDNASSVQGVAARLEVSTAHAVLSAQDKLALLRSLQQAGHRVLMVGDGVNDAPVLAAADVSVAVGGATDLAQVSADLILLGDRLAPLTLAVSTARRTLRVIRQNIAWAVLYNAAAVPLALGGWLQPWMAAVGMSASSLLVVLNAMRLLRAAPPTLELVPAPVNAKATLRAPA